MTVASWHCFGRDIYNCRGTWSRRRRQKESVAAVVQLLEGRALLSTLAAPISTDANSTHPLDLFETFHDQQGHGGPTAIKTVNLFASVAPTASGANLQMSSAFLVTGVGKPIAAPQIGEMFFVQANWTISNLTANDRYLVRFSVDSVSLDSPVISGQAGTGLGWSWGLGGWLATAGTHTVTVTIDATNTITETNEVDNSTTFTFQTATASTLPQKLCSPIGGIPFQDWTVVNYLDVDPRPGIAMDYRGGPFIYDGHNGWDITLPNFASMDRGIPVFAAADGIVSDIDDGHFDRETTSNNRPWNFVTIGHGNGWQTTYGHMAANTITVKPGQAVVQGQIIGFVGSSGSSTDAHLHFMVLHDGDSVETNFDPARYWTSPWVYAGNQSPTILDAGITDSIPFDDAKEVPASKDVFSRVSDNGKLMFFWYRTGVIPAGADYEIQWIRPDSGVAFTIPYSTKEAGRYGIYAWNVAGIWQQAVGTWQVQIRAQNHLILSRNVVVTDAIAPPELRIRDASVGNSIVIDGRTTPIDINSPHRFTLENYGGTTLDIKQIVLPTGFSVSGNAPTSIAAGSSAILTVQQTAISPGVFQGDVLVVSNDASDAQYTFRIRGSVAGIPAIGTPTITLLGPAAVAIPGGSSVLLQAQFSVTDSDGPANAANYRLIWDLVSGQHADDLLSLATPGLTVSGTSLIRTQRTIGTITTGSAGSLEVQFMDAATWSDVQAVVQGVAFAAGAPSAGPGQRIVRWSVIDPDGHRSPYAYSTVDVPQPLRTILNRAPLGKSGTVSTLEDQPYSLKLADFGFSDPNNFPSNNLKAVKFTLLSTYGTLNDNGVPVLVGQLVDATEIVAGKLIFTPKANINDSVPIFLGKFQVQDDGGIAQGGVDLDQNERVLTINIKAVNDAPVGVETTVATWEDKAYAIKTSDIRFSDPNDSPANPLKAVKVTSLSAYGTLTNRGVAVTAGQFISVADIDSGKLVFTPKANLNSRVPLFLCLFQLQDSGGTANGGVDLDPNTQRLLITIASVNDAPSGTSTTISMLRNTTFVFSAANFGFTDPGDNPGDAFYSVIITTPPTVSGLTNNGVSVIAGTRISVQDIMAGKLTFTPRPNTVRNAYASFLFRVQDNGGTANGGSDTDPTAKKMTIDVKR